MAFELPEHQLHSVAVGVLGAVAEVPGIYRAHIFDGDHVGDVVQGPDRRVRRRDPGQEGVPAEPAVDDGHGCQLPAGGKAGEEVPRFGQKSRLSLAECSREMGDDLPGTFLRAKLLDVVPGERFSLASVAVLGRDPLLPALHADARIPCLGESPRRTLTPEYRDRCHGRHLGWSRGRGAVAVPSGCHGTRWDHMGLDGIRRGQSGPHRGSRAGKAASGEAANSWLPIGWNGRGGQIRTADLLLPKSCFGTPDGRFPPILSTGEPHGTPWDYMVPEPEVVPF